MKRLENWLALLVVALFVANIVAFARYAAPTFDETFHLPAGYSYLKWHDYRMNPEHPPAAKMAAALPLLFFEDVWPPNPVLASDPVAPNETLIRRAWKEGFSDFNSSGRFGHQFLFGVKEETLKRLLLDTPAGVSPLQQLERSDFNNNASELIFWGRMAMLAFSVGLAIVVFCWSSELYGSRWAGLLSLTLLACDPNFLAHGGLITTDVPISCCLAGAVYGLWRLCRVLNLANFVIFAGFCSMAVVVKFSAVSLLPILFVIALARVISSRRWEVIGPRWAVLDSWKRRAVGVLLIFLAAGTMGYGAIWAAYGFRYAAASRAAPNDRFPIELVQEKTAAARSALYADPAGPGKPKASLMDAAVLAANQFRLLPEAYLFGVEFARMAGTGRRSYLNGDYSFTGFRDYFLWTFLLKTPIPALLAIALALMLAFIRRACWTSELAFILGPVLIYGFFVVGANLNIGHRHLLPIYPFLYVLAGRLALECCRLRAPWKGVLGGGFVSAILLSPFFVFSPPWRPQVVFPYFLSYFNEFAAGPVGGHFHLADSNLDWGQDLGELRSWLVKHSIERPIYLSYFGTADPRYYGIVHRNVPLALGGYPLEPNEWAGSDSIDKFVQAIEPGDYIAISMTNMLGVHLAPVAREAWHHLLSNSALVGRAGFSILIFRVDQRLPRS